MSQNDVYRASAIFDIPGADGKCVFTTHYFTKTVNNPATDAQEAQDIALGCVDEITNLYLPFISNTFVLEAVKVIGISNPLIGVEAPANLPGADVDDFVAIRSAPVVKLKTGLRGRSYNGRMFLLPPGEAQQNGGTMIASYNASLLAFVDGYLGVRGIVNNNLYRGCIYSKKLSDQFGTVVFNEITNWVVNDTMGTQRGRQTV